MSPSASEWFERVALGALPSRAETAERMREEEPRPPRETTEGPHASGNGQS